MKKSVKMLIWAVSVVLAFLFIPIAYIKVGNMIALSDTKELRNSLKNADEIYIYEGLPHQNSEKAAFRIEKKRNDVTEIAGFSFYTPKREASADLKEYLQLLLSSKSTYFKFSGEKKCGGFHPDFAIAWMVGDQEYYVLICYGCYEAIFVERSNQYRYDCHFDEEDIVSKLAPMHLERPKSSLKFGQ